MIGCEQRDQQPEGDPYIAVVPRGARKRIDEEFHRVLCADGTNRRRKSGEQDGSMKERPKSHIPQVESEGVLNVAREVIHLPPNSPFAEGRVSISAQSCLRVEKIHFHLVVRFANVMAIPVAAAARVISMKTPALILALLLGLGLAACSTADSGGNADASPQQNLGFGSCSNGIGPGYYRDFTYGNRYVQGNSRNC